MKTSLLTAVISTLLTGTALAATAATFDQGAPKPSDVIASAKEQSAPAIKDAGPVPVAPAKDAPAPVNPEQGETTLRIVETYVADGKASVEKETICYKADGSTPCIDEKTHEPATLPAELADFDFHKTIQEALALAARGEFRLAHDYQTRNNGQCFQCWGVMEEYGCKWVQREITVTVPPSWTWVKECAGTREVGHDCSEIPCR